MNRYIYSVLVFSLPQLDLGENTFVLKTQTCIHYLTSFHLFRNQFSYQIQSVQYSSMAHLFCMYTLFKIMIICFVGCLVCAVVLNFCVTRVTSLFFVTNRNETPCNDCGLYFLSGQNTKYRIFKNCLWFALMDFCDSVK